MFRLALALIPSIVLGQGTERAGYRPLVVEALQETGGARILGTNPNPCPFQVVVEFPQLDGLTVEGEIPAFRVLPAAATQVPLVSLIPVPGVRYGYRFAYRTYPGDPESATHDPATAYWLPWEHGAKHRLSQGYMGDFSHKDDHALDFDMDPGTPVHAARAGVVVALREDSTEGGPDLRFQDAANFVDILHEDGTFAHYSHLAPGGADVEIGQVVAAGQALGRSGETGFTAVPHLHFEVRRPVKGAEPVSVPTLFLDHRGQAASLVVGNHYPSFHSGKGPVPVPVHEMTEAELARRVEPAPATGAFDIAEERVDGVVLLHGVNGRDEPATVTLEVEGENVATGRPAPHRATVGPRTRAFLLLLKPRDGGAAWRYRYTFRLEQ